MINYGKLRLVVSVHLLVSELVIGSDRQSWRVVRTAGSPSCVQQRGRLNTATTLPAIAHS